MNWHIVSWNCRGDGLSRVRNNGVRRWEEGCYIFLLQEAGNPKLFGDRETIGTERRGRTFDCLAAPQEGVRNPRCSLAVLTQVEARLEREAVYHKDLTRPCLFTTIVDKGKIILVGTMHAYADHGGRYSRAEIVAVVNWFNLVKRDGACTDWILMGDFNHGMDRALKAEIGGVCKYKTVGRMTQSSGNEIDYLIYSKGSEVIDRAVYSVGQVFTDSDHVAICLDITI